MRGQRQLKFPFHRVDKTAAERSGKLTTTVQFSLKVSLLQLSCLLLAEPYVGPFDVVDVDRVVEPRLDEQPAIPVCDHGDAAIAAACEVGRVCRSELDVKGFQAAFLGVIHAL